MSSRPSRIVATGLDVKVTDLTAAAASLVPYLPQDERPELEDGIAFARLYLDGEPLHAYALTVRDRMPRESNAWRAASGIATCAWAIVHHRRAVLGDVRAGLR